MPDLGNEQVVGGGQDQVVVSPLQLDAPVPVHVVQDVGADVVRQVIFAIAPQCLEHRVRRDAGGGRVPQGEGRDAIGMDVLRRLD